MPGRIASFVHADKRNYLIIYLHTIGDKIANALIEMFVGAFLYSLGMPLHFIFLFFGLEFGLRGALVPLGMRIVSRLGAARGVLLSYAAIVVYFVLIGAAQYSLVLGFFAFVFQSIGRAIYYPVLDGIHAVVVKNGTRGRQLSTELALASLSAAVAIPAASFVFARYGYAPVFAGVVTALGIAALTLLKLKEDDLGIKYDIRSTYRHLVSPDFRENLLPFSLHALTIIATLIVAPVYIFATVGNFEIFGVVVGLALVIETIATIYYGARVDSFGQRRTAIWATWVKSVGDAMYAFSVYGAASAFLANAVNRIGANLFFSNYRTRIHQKALASGTPILFSASFQMALCFAEVIVLPLFALGAYFLGMKVFPAIFLVGIVGNFLAVRYFAD